MRMKDIPEFEGLNNSNTDVFEFTGLVLPPVHFNTNYTEPQIDILLYENH